MIATKRLKLRGLRLLVVASFAALAPARHSFAEPSLANVLLGAPAPVDPTVASMNELAAELASVERRPFAKDPAVQRALGEARAELSRARAAYTGGAPEASVALGLEVARAALSAADRMQARAFAAAALARLKLQTEIAEAAAGSARLAYEQARAGGAEAVRTP